VIITTVHIQSVFIDSVTMYWDFQKSFLFWNPFLYFD
jgi:hypothetical protein